MEQKTPAWSGTLSEVILFGLQQVFGGAKRDHDARPVQHELPPFRYQVVIERGDVKLAPGGPARSEGGPGDAEKTGSVGEMIKPGEGVLRDLVLFRRRGHDPVWAQRGEAPFRVPLFQGESPEYPVAFPGRVRQGGGQRSGIEIGIDIIDRQLRAGRHGVPGLHYRLGLARSGLLQEYYFFFKPGRRAAGKALQGGVYEAFQGVSLLVLS